MLFTYLLLTFIICFFYQLYAFYIFSGFKNTLFNIDIVLEWVKYDLKINEPVWSYLFFSNNGTPPLESVNCVNDSLPSLKSSLNKPKSAKQLMLEFINDPKIQELVNKKNKKN